MKNVERQWLKQHAEIPAGGVSLAELKVEINSFVWMYANENITLRQADEMALKILELLEREPTARGEQL